jgi:hypothetical protein
VARPSGKIRVLNLFSVDGGAGPAIDVYAAPAHASEMFDTRNVPLVAGVGYAQLSEIISPPANDNVGVITVFLAGKKAATPYYPGEPVPGHFELDDRAVLLLHNCPDAGVCFDTLFESGPGEQANPLPRPGTGKAMFYEASAALTPNTPGKTLWWGLGGVCLTAQGTAYEVPAASGNLALIIKPTGTAATCTETPTLSVPIAATAGQRAWLFIWGASASDVHARWVSFQ